MGDVKRSEIDALYIQTVKSLVDQLLQLVQTATVQYRAAVREHLATTCRHILRCLEETPHLQHDSQHAGHSTDCQPDTGKATRPPAVQPDSQHAGHCTDNSDNTNEASCFKQSPGSSHVAATDGHDNKQNHDTIQSTQFVNENSCNKDVSNSPQNVEFMDAQPTEHYTSCDQLQPATAEANRVDPDPVEAVSSGSTLSAAERFSAGESAKQAPLPAPGWVEQGRTTSHVETVRQANVSVIGDGDNTVKDEAESIGGLPAEAESTGVLPAISLLGAGDNQQTNQDKLQQGVCEVEGQLLSFLPQLLDQQPGAGDTDGFIHLTVERADGTVHSLKIAGAVLDTAAAVGDTAAGNTVGDNSGAVMDTTSTDNFEPAVGTSESQVLVKQESPGVDSGQSERAGAGGDRAARKGRPRGRPKKSPSFQPVLTDDNERVYPCPVCADVVRSSHALTVHLRKHSGEKPWRCGVCGRAFTTKGNMRQHEATTHSSVKPWPCTFCPKTFKEKKVLMVHQRIHTGERPYSCQKTFKEKKMFMVHQRIHNGERPYSCDLCDKTFTQGGVLKEHMLVHSGKKPHLCDLCGMEFRGASALKVHKLRHLNKKNFKCEQCNKTFVAKNDMKRHVLTHSGVKPFLCSECPKSFSRVTYLQEHVNLHRGLQPHTCPHCPAAFAETSALHRHKHKKHADLRQHHRSRSELERELTSGGSPPTPGDPGNPAAGQVLGETSVQLVFDDAGTSEEFQRLQSLVLSASNSADYSLSAADPVKQIYQVLCVNPDTQEISSLPQGEAQGTTDFSAINLLASATAQQYTLQ